uniref:site-specific DNA-methyltransferase (adenine-specific) n=1 Tax=Candidatus Kentrum sp. LFY TaxID=2126342 RepID=A0A450W6C6_9GAMM|nr:MAG: type I restriction enzyme M protein [Candidatus Kentron sp. LFY]
MLDTDTKRRIDTCRDILVGKVPDPKSQVEQITIALIYKFMDDMDLESEEMGGARSFFTGQFAKYAWSRLMAPGMGGFDMLERYLDAIARINENPGIPSLFRDIFKNAYLPYRDPETLRGFLKEIDGFRYDHSERLGDAFEYLLSVLGSQGDAGQFRTPRHLIDFMVAIVDPKKDETILDPACGTAGFLISAWKHIRAANTGHRPGDRLIPAERKRLADGIQGYDISPDMVRLSLVNLYLHGFRAPRIHEYDTLTSESRWNDHFDVILANPPFMSPKGGIRPHKRFSVQSKRSEVLFVDYMAEHLTSRGRAAIIVPEGIIFQGQNAYKQLRKLLVESYLVTVISLPAGCFNPYSGVKTSILILDKGLAKQADTIAFFKVDNDGFDLGAQRRPIDKNDLPKARAEIAEYLRRLRVGESMEGFEPTLGRVVAKERIAEGGEWNLSGGRYGESVVSVGHYPLKALKDLLEIQSGFPFKSELFNKEIGVPIIRIRDIKPNRTLTKYTGEYSSDFLVHNGDLLVGMDGEFNSVLWTGETALLNQRISKLYSFRDCLKEYVALLIPRKLKEIEDGTYAVTVKHISGKQINAIEIPLPPLSVQKEIVAEIEGYQKVIDGASQVVENYRPHISIDPEWSVVNVGELTQPEYGFTTSAADKGDARFIRITDIASDGTLRSDNAKYIELTDEVSLLLLSRGDILVARTGATYGKTMLFDEECPAVFASYLIRLQLPADRILPHYYWAFSQSEDYWTQAKSLMTGGAQPQFNGNALKQVRIPLPPLPTQHAIVAEIQEEQRLVDANRELMRRFEAKIEKTIDRVWGKS